MSKNALLALSCAEQWLRSVTQVKPSTVLGKSSSSSKSLKKAKSPLVERTLDAFFEDLKDGTILEEFALVLTSDESSEATTNIDRIEYFRSQIDSQFFIQAFSYEDVCNCNFDKIIKTFEKIGSFAKTVDLPSFPTTPEQILSCSNRLNEILCKYYNERSGGERRSQSKSKPNSEVEEESNGKMNVKQKPENKIVEVANMVSRISVESVLSSPPVHELKSRGSERRKKKSKSFRGLFSSKEEKVSDLHNFYIDKLKQSVDKPSKENNYLSNNDTWNALKEPNEDFISRPLFDFYKQFQATNSSKIHMELNSPPSLNGFPALDFETLDFTAIGNGELMSHFRVYLYHLHILEFGSFSIEEKKKAEKLLNQEMTKHDLFTLTDLVSLYSFSEQETIRTVCFILFKYVVLCSNDIHGNFRKVGKFFASSFFPINKDETLSILFVKHLLKSWIYVYENLIVSDKGRIIAANKESLFRCMFDENYRISDPDLRSILIYTYSLFLGSSPHKTFFKSIDVNDLDLLTIWGLTRSQSLREDASLFNSVLSHVSEMPPSSKKDSFISLFEPMKKNSSDPQIRELLASNRVYDFLQRRGTERKEFSLEKKRFSLLEKYGVENVALEMLNIGKLLFNELTIDDMLFNQIDDRVYLVRKRLYDFPLIALKQDVIREKHLQFLVQLAETFLAQQNNDAFIVFVSHFRAFLTFDKMQTFGSDLRLRILDLYRAVDQLFFREATKRSISSHVSLASLDLSMLSLEFHVFRFPTFIRLSKETNYVNLEKLRNGFDVISRFFASFTSTQPTTRNVTLFSILMNFGESEKKIVQSYATIRRLNVGERETIDRIFSDINSSKSQPALKDHSQSNSNSKSDYSTVSLKHRKSKNRGLQPHLMNVTDSRSPLNSDDSSPLPANRSRKHSRSPMRPTPDTPSPSSENAENLYPQKCKEKFSSLTMKLPASPFKEDPNKNNSGTVGRSRSRTGGRKQIPSLKIFQNDENSQLQNTDE